MSGVLDTQEDVIGESEIEDQSSAKILENLDKVAENVAEEVKENETIVVKSKNLAMMVFKQKEETAITLVSKSTEQDTDKDAPHVDLEKKEGRLPPEEVLKQDATLYVPGKAFEAATEAGGIYIYRYLLIIMVQKFQRTIFSVKYYLLS